MIAGFFRNAPCKLRAYNIADNISEFFLFILKFLYFLFSFFFKKKYIILLLHFRVGV